MASMKSWTLCLFTALLLADGARIKRRRGTTVCPVNGGGCHCNCQAAAAAAMPFGQMPGMPGAMPGAMPGFGPMALTAPVVTPPQAPPQSPPPPPPPPPPPQPPLPPPEPPVALPALPKVPELSSEDLPTLGPPPPPTLPPTAAPLAQLVMPTMPPPQLPNPFAGSHNPLSAIPNPMAGMPNPMAGMQNPMAGMQNPMAGMPNPMAGMPNPMSGMPNPMAMGGQSPFGQAGALNMPGMPAMPGMPGMPAGAPVPAGTPGVAGQAVPPQAMLAQAAATLPGMHQPPGASAQGLNSLASMVQQRAQGELTYHYYQYVPGYGYVYEPGFKTDGQNLAALIKDGRKTTKTCGCLQSWTHKGQSCNGYCCNPDNDAAGPWCFVMDQACQGDTWGTCEALAAAAPGPSPAASPASPAPAPAPAAAASKMLTQMTSNTTEASATDEAAVEELAAVLGSDNMEVKEEEPKRNLRASFMQRKQGLEQVEGSPCDCGGD